MQQSVNLGVFASATFVVGTLLAGRGGVYGFWCSSFDPWEVENVNAKPELKSCTTKAYWWESQSPPSGSGMCRKTREASAVRVHLQIFFRAVGSSIHTTRHGCERA